MPEEKSLITFEEFLNECGKEGYPLGGSLEERDRWLFTEFIYQGLSARVLPKALFTPSDLILDPSEVAKFPKEIWHGLIADEMKKLISM